jgi:predicted ATPase
MARLDRLGQLAKRVAQTGAVIGREFSYELVSPIADLPEPQLRVALDKLTNSGLLYRRPYRPTGIARRVGLGRRRAKQRN